jgi:hypothetical protein
MNLTTIVQDALMVVGALYSAVSVAATLWPAGKVKSTLQGLSLDIEKLQALFKSV